MPEAVDRARGSTGPGPGGAGSAGPPPELVVAADQVGDLPGLRRTGAPAAAAARSCRPCAPIAAPEAGAGHDDVGGDHAVRSVRTPVTRPPACSMPITRVEPWKRGTAGLRRAGPARRPRGRPWPARRWGCAGRRGPARGRRSGCSRTHSSGVDDPALDAPGGGPALLAVQVGEPLRGGGDLQAADLVEAPRAVDVDALELLDGVARELGHRLGRVGLEHQPGRVRGGAAGERQRPLVDDGDAGPSRARSARRRGWRRRCRLR